MRYDIALFDADGTLFDFARAEDESIRYTMSSFGIEPTDERVAKYSEINDGLWKALERGEIEKNVLLYHRFELFCQYYGFDADHKKMAQTYMNTLATKGHLIEGAEELIKKLFKKVKLYIVTNGVEFIQEGRYAVSGIGKYFDGKFISGVIGHEKPCIEYFEHVEKHIENFDRSRTIIIGDSLTSDIKGGINFGIDTCWYNPRHKNIPEEMKITYIVDNFDDIYSIITNESER